MRSRRAVVVPLVLATLAFGLLALPATAAEPADGLRYIVRLADPPLASYQGEVDGLAATSPKALGEVRLDVDSAASVAYLDHLQAQQDAVVAAAEAAVGRAVEVVFRYRYAYNGLALVLGSDEAATVASLPGVAQVQEDYEQQILTDAGPAWIGAPSIWDGSATGGERGTRGEGVVVGVIDTGVNHDHPSFAAVGGDGYEHSNPRGRFFGLCEPITGLPFCNDKLIGVHDFTGTTPLDDNGHGSHTASTSAGNVVAATVVAPTITIERDISGVAPHANLITYKACLAVGSCIATSLVAAIDQATADQVDVINYSIGGTSRDPWADAAAQSFLGARDAGVFVAASAGNSGPGAETIGSPADAPWLLAVGAGTHDRAFVNFLVDMSGGATAAPADIEGRSLTSGYGPAPIVHAADFGDGQCLTPFPPGTFDGEIVICDRGVNPRLEKGRNVKLGGAGGLVLSNSEIDGESTVADPHELPAVAIAFSDAQVLEAWVRDGGSGHTATISGTTADIDPANGDITAGFSSRGPNPSVPDVLKPDIIAPGVDILAALHTTNPLAAPEFALLSGTSMSSPHMAGSAALIRALQPTWTASEVQSALMSTSLDDVMRKDDAVTPADPFDEGAGRVDLTRAGEAALLLDESAIDFETANPALGGDPTTLNLASLTDEECVGTCSWTRTVRNPRDHSVTWTARTSGDLGGQLSVSPRRFTLRPGAVRKITVTADVAGDPIGQWQFGAVEFTASHRAAPTAHWPVTVAAGGVGDSLVIESDSPQGSTTRTYSSPVRIRDLNVTVSGVRQGVLDEFTLEQDPTPLDPYDLPIGTHTILVDVPAGARLLAAETGETTATDLDLYVGLDSDGDGQAEASEQLCASAGETADEACSLPDPDGGTYWVLVQNWLTGRVIDDVDLLVAVVPGTDDGNFDVTGPRSVPANRPFEVTFTWDVATLEPGEVWFGLVELGSTRRQASDVGSIFVTLRNPN